MSILQISRIQHRRGLQQDLPQLASAELGWSVDERRLFIGNGTLLEGAPSEGITEILTQYSDVINIVKSYIFKGYAAGYTAQTGATLSTPTVRLFQDKLDDFVNVKDFGAIGDGNANDLAAINRALQQIYMSNKVQTVQSSRRTLYFPAGKYKISGGTILIPAWARIVGDGIDSTSIVQVDNTQLCVAQTCDSNFTVSPNIGQPGAILPSNIRIENLSFVAATGHSFIVESASDVSFLQVGLKGISNFVDAPTYDYAGVKFAAFRTAPMGITFELCQFANSGYAVVSDVGSSNVKFNNCSFSKIYTGLRLGINSADSASSPKSIRITNSSFDQIGNSPLDISTYVSGIVSSCNSYYYDTNGNPLSLTLNSGGNYSLSDYFVASPDSRVINNGNQNVRIDSDSGVALGSAVIGMGAIYTMAPTSGSITTDIILPPAGVLHYTIMHAQPKFGTLTFSNDSFVDSSIDTGNATVALSVSGNSLVYTNAGASVDLRYNITHF